MREQITMPPDHDEEQPQTPAYREAAVFYYMILEASAAHIAAAKNPHIGLAQIRFALDFESRSMRDVAAELKVTVACISKGAKEFIEENNLPTPRCMKSKEASDSYREARNQQLQ